MRDIPVGFVPGLGRRRTTTRPTFPRSYVIPAGDAPSAPRRPAKRLVDLLIASNGRVTQAKAAVHRRRQVLRRPAPTSSTCTSRKRGLVNTLLEPGLDITDRVDDLYAGPAGWSQALTWGATVDTLVSELPAVADRARARRRGHLRSSRPRTRDLVLDPRDAEDVLAINALLGQGVKLTRLTDGSVLIPASARAAARRRQAQTRGLTLTSAPASWSGATIADKVVVAYAGGSEVRDSCSALGFEAKR